MDLSTRKSYEERLKNCASPLLKKLFRIIIEKQSNLCVALDFETLRESLECIDRIGKHVCMVKTHCEKYIDADIKESLNKINSKKKEYNFLLFEDRKIYDSAGVVRDVFRNFLFRYADIATLVPILGEESYQALEEALEDLQLPEDEPRGCFAVIETSFKGKNKSSFPPPDIEGCLEDASKHLGVCIGIIAQEAQVLNDCQMIKATPGIHMQETTDGIGQRWKPPSQAIKKGADIIIVGRGIIAASITEQEEVALKYKDAAWKAYLEDLNRDKM